MLLTIILPALLILTGIAILILHVRAERRDARELDARLTRGTPYTGPLYTVHGREIG